MDNKTWEREHQKKKGLMFNLCISFTLFFMEHFIWAIYTFFFFFFFLFLQLKRYVNTKWIPLSVQQILLTTNKNFGPRKNADFKPEYNSLFFGRKQSGCGEHTQKKRKKMLLSTSKKLNNFPGNYRQNTYTHTHIRKQKKYR